MSRQCWDAAKHLLSATPDGELVRVGGSVVEAYDWQLKKCPGHFFSIKKGEREFGPYKIDAKQDGVKNTLLDRAFVQKHKDMGWVQASPHKSKWRKPGQEEGGTGANYINYCTVLKVECGVKRSSEGAGGGAAKKKSKKDNLDLDDVLGPPPAPVQPTMGNFDLDDDNGLGPPPVQPSMVFGSGAADASLGTADMSLGSPGGGGSAAAMEQTEDLADLLLGDTQLDEVDKWDLDKMFADFPAPDPAEVA